MLEGLSGYASFFLILVLRPWEKIHFCLWAEQEFQGYLLETPLFRNLNDVTDRSLTLVIDR
jgi:hypothetical protein